MLPPLPVRVYPRSRGGTSATKLKVTPRGGLSPLARGNRHVTRGEPGAAGSIPARAGEPCLWAGRYRLARVYPRSRGGTSEEETRVPVGGGLSPLARGNHGPELRFVGFSGSIPARAGEPFDEVHILVVIGVYPRSRGGT